MKKMKNAMLVMISGLLFITVATQSCKKDDPDPGPTGPTITSVTPTSGPVGTTITIVGSNLTGATVKFNGVTAVTTTVTSTSITCTVPAGATTGNLTVTTANGTATFAFTVTTLPSSNDIASDRLIGHWNFDANGNENISNSAPATVSGVTFASAGQIGNCATFNNGYLLYNPIDLISRDTALQSYTISMWVNLPAATGTDPLRSLFQVTGNRFPDLWGNVALELVNSGVVGDTLALNTRQVQVDGLAPYVHMESAGVNYGNSTNKWTFLTVTYDGNGTNQTIKIYANGALIKTQELTTVDKSATSTQSTFRVVPTGNAAVPTPTPANKVYIGTVAFNDRGNTGGDGYGNFAPLAADRPWAAGSITGKIDDIRLFNTPLSDADVLELYTRGAAGN